MVMFDLNYFKYCFLKPSGLEFNEVLLQDDFEKLADDLLDEDTDTFLYRDFNARNVMVKDGEPYFIDFQGGRRGPIYYDVASFAWQARAKFSQKQKDAMLKAYLDALSEYMTVDASRFSHRLRLFILFRLLQVLGAYGFRGWVEHKANFVTSIPAAIAELRTLAEEGFEEYPYLSSKVIEYSLASS
jgi:aminoglycoside/choline kinase family phosphotransferase